MSQIRYETLSKDDFDAMVTGELTHYAIWLEKGIIDIITDYFIGNSKKREDFERLILLRDGLTFQDKIEVTRAMIPLLEPKASQLGLRVLLKRIEEYKGFRNTFAHGRDVSGQTSANHLRVEIVSRSGNKRVIEVTPESHRTMMDDTEQLLKDLTEARRQLTNI